jgi:hypothetical protein
MHFQPLLSAKRHLVARYALVLLLFAFWPQDSMPALAQGSTPPPKQFGATKLDPPKMLPDETGLKQVPDPGADRSHLTDGPLSKDDASWVTRLVNMLFNMVSFATDKYLKPTANALVELVIVVIHNPNVASPNTATYHPFGVALQPQDKRDTPYFDVIGPDLKQDILRIYEVMRNIAISWLLVLFIANIWKAWVQAAWKEEGHNLMGAVGRLIATAATILAWPTINYFFIQISNEAIDYLFQTIDTQDLTNAVSDIINFGIAGFVGVASSQAAAIVAALTVAGPAGLIIGAAAELVAQFVFFISLSIVIFEAIHLLVLKAIQTILILAQFVFAPIFLVFMATTTTEKTAYTFIRASVEVSLWTFVWAGFFRILVAILTYGPDLWGKGILLMGILQLMIQVPTFIKKAEISPASDFLSPKGVVGGIRRLALETFGAASLLRFFPRGATNPGGAPGSGRSGGFIPLPSGSPRRGWTPPPGVAPSGGGESPPGRSGGDGGRGGGGGGRGGGPGGTPIGPRPGTARRYGGYGARTNPAAPVAFGAPLGETAAPADLAAEQEVDEDEASLRSQGLVEGARTRQASASAAGGPPAKGLRRVAANGDPNNGRGTHPADRPSSKSASPISDAFQKAIEDEGGITFGAISGSVRTSADPTSRQFSGRFPSSNNLPATRSPTLGAGGQGSDGADSLGRSLAPTTDDVTNTGGNAARHELDGGTTYVSARFAGKEPNMAAAARPPRKPALALAMAGSSSDVLADTVSTVDGVPLVSSNNAETSTYGNAGGGTSTIPSAFVARSGIGRGASRNSDPSSADLYPDLTAQDQGLVLNRTGPSALTSAAKVSPSVDVQHSGSSSLIMPAFPTTADSNHIGAVAPATISASYDQHLPIRNGSRDSNINVEVESDQGTIRYMFSGRNVNGPSLEHYDLGTSGRPDPPTHLVPPIGTGADISHVSMNIRGPDRVTAVDMHVSTRDVTEVKSSQSTTSGAMQNEFDNSWDINETPQMIPYTGASQLISRTSMSFQGLDRLTMVDVDVSGREHTEVNTRLVQHSDRSVDLSGLANAITEIGRGSPGDLRGALDTISVEAPGQISIVKHDALVSGTDPVGSQSVEHTLADLQTKQQSYLKDARLKAKQLGEEHYQRLVETYWEAHPKNLQT